MVTLIDGREVDNSSEEWRLECLARDRHVANMRRIPRELRQDYLDNVKRKEGDEAGRRLRDEFKRDWERRRAERQAQQAAECER